MAVKVEHPSPRPRSNKFSLGLSLRSQSFNRRASEKQNDDSDDWYIPYNGPIEKPRLSPELRPRDSWGDLISTYGIDDALGDSDSNTRYGDVRLDGVDAHHEKAVVGRNRALSGVSYRTTSSSVVDANRSNGVVARRATLSRGGAQSVSSYSATDTGGVGESPMPPQRLAHLAQNATNSHRVSITSLFSFNGSSRKSRSSPSRSPPMHAQDGSRFSPPKPLSSLLRSDSYVEEKRDSSKTRGRQEKEFVPESQATAPSKTADQAYYDSYYSTLLTTPKADDKTPTSNRPTDTSSQRYQISGTRGTDRPSNPQTFPSLPAHQLIPHPYASPSTVHPEWPSSTAVRHQLSDVATTTHHQRQKPVPENPSSGSRPNPSNQRRLRTSVSSPDLFGARAANLSQRSSTKERTYHKDRWLAIETWCDAVVFPRPRFYVKQGDKEKRAMIITPPDTPIAGTVGNLDEAKASPIGNPLPVLPSRPLLHSKSQNDLRTSTDTGASSRPLISRRRGATLPNGTQPRVITNVASYDTGLNVGRPRPPAQDGARSDSPAPSLTQVLEDSRQLNEMRQKWQIQATNSFQNKRCRSLSRARSKSLSSGQPRNRPKEGETSKVMESIDYLATRTFLGSQSVMPTVHPTKPSHRPSDKFGTGTTSSKSHSQSGSLIKSSSKSSKVSHRAHSRNESWGQSALKYAKSTAVSLCGFSENSLSPQDEHMAGHDGLLKGDAGVTTVQSDTDAKPLLFQNQKTGDIAPETPCEPPFNPWGVSPTPSGGYEAVGIALSTPPPLFDRHSPSSDDEPINLPDHPYGQSSLTHVHKAPSVSHRIRDSWRGSDYAGPHPATSNLVVQGDISDVAVRHRLPPQAIIHPYAQVTSTGHQSVEDALKVHVRSDSQIPPEEKMWAQLSPGGIQEILPTDISYSPFETTTPLAIKQSESARKTRSTVSVGEALASAMRPRGSDEGHEKNPVITLSSEGNDEPEDDRQSVSEEKMLTPPFRLRHPYGTAISEPAKLTPTHSDAMLDSPLRTGHSSGSSPGMHSQNSSPRISPRPLGSMDDLDHFRDLFYRPSALGGDATGSVVTGSTTLPWDIKSHRTGSGLTSLARQLSMELEELNARFDSLDGSLEPSSHEGMRFVLSEAGSSRDMTSSLRLTLDREKFSFLQPSFSVPEDIDSAGTSSVVRQSPADDEDDTLPIRLGIVESVSTPIATAVPQPLSGHLSLVDEELGVHEEADTTIRPRNPRAVSTEEAQYAGRQPLSASLLAPSADPTRSSYMTTSTTGSRMSNLSDFPVPPGDMDAHMRLVEAYLAIAPADVRSLPSEGSPRAPAGRRMTFGGDEDMDDTLSPP